ncbi:DUF2637 domain-containing protein [Streptomyces sp. NPDC048718]|uniref:DUF2637 domain-containing protein n=1 Tax=Streptomyces sp. NPDC048718 TaxID=3365587 RepID=UPI00371A7245
MTEETADRFALTAAVIVIAILTAAGFWLSYAHLAEVAGQHGLDHSPERRWAWPATLDAFIIAGELMMFRASLRRVTDWSAIGVTVTGSLGSVVLNVFGVGGSAPESVPLLDYVVAAVPPTASMLAFGVLMRQIHQGVTSASKPDPDQTGPAPAPGPEPGPDADPEPGPNPELEPGPDTGPEPGPDAEPNPDPGPNPELEPGPNPDPEPGPGAGPRPDRGQVEAASARRGARRARPAPARPRTVRARVQAGRPSRTGPGRLSEDQVVEMVLPYVPAVLAREGNAQVTRAQLRAIMRSRKIQLGNEHMGPVLTRVRAATAATTSPEGVR